MQDNKVVEALRLQQVRFEGNVPAYIPLMTTTDDLI